MDPHTHNKTEAPNILNEELKMPEEEFRAPAPESKSYGLLIPVLASLLTVLLIILAGLVLWKDEIMEILRPAPTLERFDSAIQNNAEISAESTETQEETEPF